MTYEKYCSDCKDKGFKPTMSEKQFSEMMGMQLKEPVYLARDSASHKHKEPTMANYEANKPKKKYAPKVDRTGWSEEQIKARKAENVRRYRESQKLKNSQEKK